MILGRGLSDYNNQLKTIFGYKVDICAKRITYARNLIDGTFYKDWDEEYIHFYRIYDNITSLKKGLKMIDKLYGIEHFYVTCIINGESWDLNKKITEWWNKNE